jgi:hypothetical protein
LQEIHDRRQAASDAWRKEYSAEYKASEHGKKTIRSWYYERGGKELVAAYAKSPKYLEWKRKYDQTAAPKEAQRKWRAKPESKQKKKQLGEEYRARPEYKEQYNAYVEGYIAEKRYWDDVCGKAWSGKGQLDRHLLTNTHTNMIFETRYYSCDFCDEAFRDDYGLQQHLESPKHASAQAEVDILMEDVIPFPWEGSEAG